MNIYGVAVLAACVLAPGLIPCAHADRLDDLQPVATLPLPAELREVSGLAAIDATQVHAVADEVATVYTVDIGNGAITGKFSLGKPKIKGDFEGLAVSNGDLYLVTSDGLIYQTRMQPQQKRPDFAVFDTGLKHDCEIEGIAADAEGALILACKRSAMDPDRKRLVLYRWHQGDRPGTLRPWREIPVDSAGKCGTKTFAAAGLEYDSATGVLLVVDSRHARVLEVGGDGTVRACHALPKGRHRQPEGIALMPDGRLVIADEGGKKNGYLTVYGRADNE